MKDEERVMVRMREAATATVWHWRGARPDILDLDENQSGSLLCLIFVREGECCLLPLAWHFEQALEETQDVLRPALPFAEEALDGEVMALTKQGLEQDGWRVSGRLDFHFEGRWAAEGFWKQVEAFLR